MAEEFPFECNLRPPSRDKIMEGVKRKLASDAIQARRNERLENMGEKTARDLEGLFGSEDEPE